MPESNKSDAGTTRWPEPGERHWLYGVMFWAPFAVIFGVTMWGSNKVHETGPFDPAIVIVGLGLTFGAAWVAAFGEMAVGREPDGW